MAIIVLFDVSVNGHRVEDDNSREPKTFSRVAAKLADIVLFRDENSTISKMPHPGKEQSDAAKNGTDFNLDTRFIAAVEPQCKPNEIFSQGACKERSPL